LALLLKAKVADSLWAFNDWQLVTGGGEGTLRASLRSEALNRVGKASTNGVTTRGGRGDRSGVFSTFRRFFSNAEGFWLAPKELVDLLEGGRGVGLAVFISKREGKVVGYW
jgi:hypothetical protein